jgi:hypothetical protein
MKKQGVCGESKVCVWGIERLSERRSNKVFMRVCSSKCV